jgi:hypothetical protein
MAKCNNCNKSGFFFKVDSNSICKDCVRITQLKAEEQQLQERIAKLQAAFSIDEQQFLVKIAKMKSEIDAYEKSYNEIKEKRYALYQKIADKAKKDALSEITNQMDIKNTELQAIDAKVEERQKKLECLLDECGQTDKKILSNANKLGRIQSLFKSMQYATKRFFDQESLSKEILNETLPKESEDLLSTTVNLKLHLMDIRDLRKLYNQNNKVINDLLVKYQERYTTKSNITIYRLMVIALEAELQNVLYNLKYSKLDRAIQDIKAITAKYEKIATDGNQNIASTVKRFIGEIEYLFIEAIKIEYQYYIQKERIKEEQKALRDQMRQEAAERKALEEERKKVEQEAEKYRNEMLNIKEQVKVTDDALKIAQLEERLAKIQAQLGEVEHKKEEITKLQHGQAGYIYILSNLGCYGENTFKIGMTRRINPLDRVDELSDASVPFRFDVHSFIFSNKAPDLEYKLHKQLHNQRVNKVNLRKEFFNTTIDELEDLVYSLEPSAEFNRTMMAEQYFQSMAVEEVPESVAIIDDENTDDDERD